MNFVNGYSNPRFDIYNGNNFVETINLDLTMSAGLVEKINEHSIQHELQNLTKEKEILGYSIDFKLSYAQYSDKTNTLNIKKLLKYEKEKKTLILYPRADVLGRYFTVLGMNDTIEIGINKGAESAQGNRLIELKYTTKYLLDDLLFLDPDDIIVPFTYKQLVVI